MSAQTSKAPSQNQHPAQQQIAHINAIYDRLADEADAHLESHSRAEIEEIDQTIEPRLTQTSYKL